MDTRDQTEGPTEEQPRPRRLLRSRRDRVLGGVCGGLGEYFDVDPLIFRILAIALLLVGGASVVLYAAALVLVPDAPQGAPVRPAEDRNRLLTLLAVAVAVVLLSPLLLPPVLVVAAILIPLAVLFLAGLGVWWLISGEGVRGGTLALLKRSALGTLVLAGLAVVAVGGAWTAGLSGGVVAASLVFGAGLALTIAAFAGHARWLILPALALALPVAFVSAAGIDLRGGVGERDYRPRAATEVRDGYRLGMGRMVVDLRNTELPAGDTPLSLDLGVGEAVLLVADDVCVKSRSQVGLGATDLFDRFDGGVDLARSENATARTGGPRLVLDAHVGVGHLAVGHEEIDHRRGGPRGHEEPMTGRPNAACAGDAVAEIEERGARS